MHRLVVLAILGVLVAGCMQGSPASTASTESPTETVPGMRVRGVVQDQDLQPVPRANVTLIERNLTVEAGPDGRFDFGEFPNAFYTVRADAPDLLPQTLTARPGQNASLLFTLTRMAEEPRHESVQFAGRLECVAEYLIVPGSCDRALEPAGGPRLFDGKSIFLHVVQTNWKSVVVDVVFDPDAMPLLDGVRVTVRGGPDAAALGSYEQYGRFHGSTSYTFRLEPDQSYTDGVAPVPGNATAFELDVMPQGHGYHATCDVACFLGVGAGADVEFELLVTTFYVEPAPADFTLQ